MLKSVREVLISIVALLVLDGIYIYLTHKIFADQIVNVQRVVMTLKPMGALVCYILLIAGLNYFIIQRNRSIPEAFFLGLVIYGVYDSTNYATLKKWEANVAIMDTLWGGSLFALTTAITYYLA
uniref:DUF2177 family protein n=1 Tax=viral metagenome TaxID=1070528 RepID=A0A6C0L6Z9_9ZZZZ